jgi:hypothetical protein
VGLEPGFQAGSVKTARRDLKYSVLGLVYCRLEATAIEPKGDHDSVSDPGVAIESWRQPGVPRGIRCADSQATRRSSFSAARPLSSLSDRRAQEGAAATRGRGSAQGAPQLRRGRLRIPVQADGEVAEPEEALPVGHRQGIPEARAVARNGRRPPPRSRELERYQHLSPTFRAQTVDLIAQVLFSDTRSGTPAPEDRDEETDHLETVVPEGEFGGVDGTRTRDLRRDRPAF